MQTTYSFLNALNYGLLICLSVGSFVADANVIRGNVKIVDRADRELTDRSNVIVFVDGLRVKSTQTGPAEYPKISHSGMQFTPRVVPIVKGDSIDFVNDDVMFHNVFSLSKANAFDLGIYPEGTSKFVRFEKTGLVKIYCNIHPEMIGNILVLNNGFFTVTDRDGNFEITNVPEGNFNLRVWHEFADAVSRPITIINNGQINESFDLKETKTIRRHKNKFGKNYKKKY